MLISTIDGAMSGQLRIKGLPFSALDIEPNFSLRLTNITFPASVEYMTCGISGSSFIVFGIRTATSIQQIDAADFATTNTDVLLTGVYRAT